MSHASAGALLGYLRHAVGAQPFRALPDAQLLRRFAAHREEAAFAALMQRHGRLVWGVCRNVLRREQDAEDAFQATFLVLARRAASIRNGESVGSWLYGVARRVAVRARQAAARREARERLAAAPAERAPAEVGLRELQAVLDEEVARLPEKYRAPFVLCCLGGRDRKAAAAELGWKEGTVSSRIAQARRLLQGRLARRGVALSAALCAAAVGGGTAAAAVPEALARATARAAALVAAGRGGGAVGAHVLALTEWGAHAMWFTKWKVAAAIALVLALAGAGVGLVPGHAPAARVARPALKRALKAGPAEKDEVKPAELLKQAAEAAQSIDDKTWKVWELMSVAEAQAKAGQKDAAAKTFAEAIEAARRVRGSEKDHRLRDVAEAQARAGDVKAAKETADGIEMEDSRASALSAVATAQAKAGDFKGAEETIGTITSDVRKGEALMALLEARAKAGRLDEASAAAAQITEDFGKIRAGASLARAHHRAKDAKAVARHIEEARKVYDALPEDDKMRDTKSAAAHVLAEALAETGDVAGARKLAEAVKKEPWQWIALGRVAAAQARTGDVKGALATAAAIKNDPLREEAVKDVLAEQLKAGDVKGARKTLEGLKRPYWRAESLIAIARAQAKAGDATAARDSLDSAFEEAQGVEEKEGLFGNAANACYAHIAQAMAELGHEKDAAAWAAGQSGPLRKAQALLSVAEGMALRKEAAKKK
jgi:RNA polymerase sigma factor (sigma-70 family)